MITLSLLNSSQHQQLELHPGTWVLGGEGPADRECLVLRKGASEAGQVRLTLNRQGTQLELQAAELAAPAVRLNGHWLAAGQRWSVAVPCCLQVGRSWIQVACPLRADGVHGALCSIPRRADRAGGPPISFDRLGAPPSAKTLERWFEALAAMQRRAASAPEFFSDAAQAVVEPGGLDAGLILMRCEGRWQIAASYVPDAPHGMSFHPHVVERVAEERQTLYHSASLIERMSEPPPATSIVASPVLDADHQVVGVVYGSRHLNPENRRCGIRSLEAQWIQLVAEAVSAGVGRLQQEAEAARTRVLLEQAFSPEVARQLQHHPEVLQGRQREVTILFADLRGFAAISDRLGARQTYCLLADIMDRLTNHVLEQEGVIIDYFGDGLAAMWNAPTDQPDHALRACQAAIAMQNELPALSDKWMSLVQRPLRLGVGVHTGIAQVGNAGSRRRLKYGPRGPTVNLASRIEAATKRLCASLLISEATRRQLPARAVARRLGTVRLSGVSETVDLFELVSLQAEQVEPQLLDVVRQYETALQLYEQGEWEAACQLLEQVQTSAPQLSVSFLAQQAQVARQQPIADAPRRSAIFDLTG